MNVIALVSGSDKKLRFLTTGKMRSARSWGREEAGTLGWRIIRRNGPEARLSWKGRVVQMIDPITDQLRLLSLSTFSSYLEHVFFHVFLHLYLQFCSHYFHFSYHTATKRTEAAQNNQAHIMVVQLF